MSKNLGNLLVVDDNGTNRDLLSRRLERKGYRVTTANGGRLALELVKSNTFDLVLLDLMMPEMNGNEVLERLRKNHSSAELPVIMVTARGESDSVVECLDAGANDYVTKPVDFPVLFARLQPQLDRKKAEQALVDVNRELEARVVERTSELESVNEWLVREIATRRQAEEQARLLLETTAEAIFGIDSNGTCTFCNPACIRLLGYSDGAELIDRNMFELALPAASGEADSQGNPEIVWRAVKDGTGAHFDDATMQQADGTIIPVELWTRPMFREDDLVGAVVTFVDITERKMLDQRFQQSQKLEAVGQLAGGIAHEFNNLLMIAGGYIERAGGAASDASIREDYLREAQTAVNRAAKLTKQLLVFSRKPILENQVVEIGELLGTVNSLLRPLVDERIELQIDAGEEPAFAEVDQDQLIQALVNLVINASDAIPESGTIELGYAVTQPRPAEGPASDTDAAPRRQVALFVKDNGMGMDAATQQRIFEPFFTTKGPDSGTGLGLAMVYRFVEQSNGSVDVQSEVGEGTRFTLSFPLVEPLPGRIDEAKDAVAPRGNGEVILVVEDEKSLRKLVSDDLEELGYKVYTACDGPHALEVEAEFGESIDLLVSDMVMPGFSGTDVARALRQTQANMKVLLMSGYPTQGQNKHTEVPEGTPFLSKPVSRAALATKIREVLDDRPVASRESSVTGDRATASSA